MKPQRCITLAIAMSEFSQSDFGPRHVIFHLTLLILCNVTHRDWPPGADRGAGGVCRRGRSSGPRGTENTSLGLLFLPLPVSRHPCPTSFSSATQCEIETVRKKRRPFPRRLLCCGVGDHGTIFEGLVFQVVMHATGPLASLRRHWARSGRGSDRQPAMAA